MARDCGNHSATIKDSLSSNTYHVCLISVSSQAPHVCCRTECIQHAQTQHRRLDSGSPGEDRGENSLS